MSTIRSASEIEKLFQSISEKEFTLWNAYNSDVINDDHKNRIDSLSTARNVLAWILGYDDSEMDSILIEMRYEDQALEEIANGYEKFKKENEYEVIDYFDVWGNEQDGWEVNNLCKLDRKVYLSPEDFDNDIYNELVRIHYIACPLDELIIEYSDSDLIEISSLKNGFPICRLQKAVI